MTIVYFLYIAFFLWFVQQVNDSYNAFLNREHVPKMFWLSAATSFASGLFLFYFLYIFFDASVNTFQSFGDVISQIIHAINSRALSH